MSADFGKCALYNKTSGDNIFHIVNQYGGIPQNLVTNLIILSILVVLFIVLRKSAWKVVNKIVNKDDMERWTQVFFSFTFEVASTIGQEARGILNRGARRDPGDGEPEPETDVEEDEDAIEEAERPPQVVRQQSVTKLTFWQWLKTTFTAPDDYIFDKCGDDALQYLRFQRHVIFYLLFIMVLAICVVLPLNFQGTLYADVTSFEHTTLANLDPDSDLLWVHLCLSFIFFPVAILIMRRFSVDLRFTQVNMEISHTLMIERIPKMFCRSTEELQRHFDEAYPTVEITDIR